MVSRIINSNLYLLYNLTRGGKLTFKGESFYLCISLTIFIVDAGACSLGVRLL